MKIKNILITPIAISISQIAFTQVQHEVEGKSKITDSGRILDIQSTSPDAWIDFKTTLNNNVFSRGYIGVYSGNYDMDFGTNNSSGKTHLVTQVTPRLTVDKDGKIGIGTENPSSILEIQSTSSGFLPPRMTEGQRDAISGASDGMIVYNTSTSKINYYDGGLGSWSELLAATVAPDTIVVGSTSFTSTNSDFTVIKSTINGGARISDNVNIAINAPFTLPVGSTITSVTYYYIDNDASGQLTIDIFRENMLGSFGGVTASTNTGVGFADPSIQTQTIALNHVVESDFSYHVKCYSPDWDSTGDKYIKGAQITYTKP